VRNDFETQTVVALSMWKG